MTATPTPDQTALVSTGVVAKILGLNQDAIRAMIESGSLPSPQWVSLGKRVERAYTQEWLLLALERMRSHRLATFQEMKSPFIPSRTMQFAIRFEGNEWTLDSISSTATALDNLWALCNEALEPERPTPSLRVRRLSAGSPFDLLISVATELGVPAAAVTLLIYVLKNPEQLAGAIPRAIAEWREQWARADRAKVDRVRARIDVKEFEAHAKNELDAMTSRPSVTQLVGPDDSGSVVPEPPQNSVPARTEPRELTVDRSAPAVRVVEPTGGGDAPADGAE